jgi:two-component system phosphate regulon response regulator PhoB
VFARPRRARRRLFARDRAARNRLRFHPEPSGGTAGRESPAGQPCILVVDDETPIRVICRVNLEASGLAVVEAPDGEQALELARSKRPALVLLDVMMPRVDGWEVAERLAAEPATREIPVVFLSARAAPDDRRLAQRLGAVGYIVKPFDPVQLPQTIEEVLERLGRGERERLQQELVDR